MRIPSLTSLLLLFAASSTMAIDVGPLWDFSKPEVSEQRFRQALERATGDDALILQTQIARTYGLRKDFEAARRILRQIESAITSAGPEARIRYHLELGRSFASATHTPEQMTPDDKTRARQSFEAALNTARAVKMDAPAVDSIHMFAFLDTTPADQLKWGQAALEIVQARIGEVPSFVFGQADGLKAAAYLKRSHYNQPPWASPR